ncbi:TetR/AcrR family transcriptional regulator [bacterium]|nr:TetR/AcrR family transcriptional regulator [bacterium]
MKKTKFTREDVVLAAVSVIDSEGISQLTARKVAVEMGASTAPVYSNFKNMDDLAVAAKKATVEIMMALLEKPGEQLQFINIGEGVLQFAKNHPYLYDALFLQPTTSYDPGPQIMDRILEKMATIPELKTLQPVERLILLKKMAIFTHGMASEICSGFLNQYQWRELLLLLEEVGEALVAASHRSLPRKEQDNDLLGTFWSKCHNSPKFDDCLETEGDSDD